MASQPKQNSENRSFMNIVSDIAFGSRTLKNGDEAKQNLDDVLTELEVSQRESDDLYIVPPFDAVDSNVQEPQRAPKPAAKAVQKVVEDVATEVDDTLRLADGHRQRLEKLLDDARQIEEMLAKEAAEARALAEKVNLEEKRTAAARAAQVEHQAVSQAKAAIQQRDAAVAEHTKTTTDIRALHEAVEAATTSVADLQSKLAEAQKLVIQSKLKLRENETRAEQVAGVAEKAKVAAHSAERRAAKCREDRAAAEAELRQAEKIANSIATTMATLERIRGIGTTSK